MRVEISKLHQRLGSTIIYVTHDQTEAMTLGTRIVVMKDGVVQQIDTPQNLYEHPCNKFVAGFIGSPQMNMITADAVEEDGEVSLRFAGQKITLNADRAQALKKAAMWAERLFWESVPPISTGMPTASRSSARPALMRRCACMRCSAPRRWLTLTSATPAG